MGTSAIVLTTEYEGQYVPITNERLLLALRNYRELRDNHSNWMAAFERYYNCQPIHFNWCMSLGMDIILPVFNDEAYYDLANTLTCKDWASSEWDGRWVHFPNGLSIEFSVLTHPEYVNKLVAFCHFSKHTNTLPVTKDLFDA